MQALYKRKVLCLMLFSALGSSLAVAAEDSVELSDIEVVGTTPLHGVGLPADMVPGNVQTANSEDIERVKSLDLSDFMTRTLSGVNINSAQNNPYQPDVYYRGFSATPLLGMPQGLAVYMDGVRLNAPFGDNVHWDTIPESAIGSINLMPGSNPLFGLNTLGGALSIQSKNGFTHPGHSIQAYGGSFNRRAVEIESGANDGSLGYFVTGNWFKEDGWRDHSQSEVKQAFANVSWRSETSTLDLSLTAVDNDLNGNGASPIELVQIDREAVFTWPDNTQNKMQLLNLSGSHWINDAILASGNAYYRHKKTDSFNGDGSPYEAGDLVTINAAGATVLSDNYDAVNNRGFLKENSGGLQGQLTFLNDLAGMENQLVTGASYDRGTSDYRASVELAQLTADRGTVGTGIYDYGTGNITNLLTGVSVKDTGGRVNVTAKNRSYSLFFTDTLSVTDALNLTLSGRYNNTQIKVTDHLYAGSSINATHTFVRFNPAAGLTFAFNDAASSYVNYSESSRAPTPSELGCSDPDAPCTLPNSFLADPPLKQVVAKSWEAGLRGQLAGNIAWNAGAFTTTNHDDILFISTSGATGNTGYFSNIGKTRRQGIELGVSGETGRLNWAVNYAYVNAEFRSPLTISSPNHPDKDGNGDIQVQKGNKMPGIPEHNLKLLADYAITPQFSIGGDMLVNSDQYYRGDEANLLGKLGGYAVVNLHADYQLTPHIKFFAKVNNLFDKDYANFGLLGEPDEVFDGSSGPGRTPAMNNPRFQGAGAPRAGWLGIKVTM